MNMKRFIAGKLLALLLSGLMATAVQAHHSFAVHFVDDQLVTVEGVVSRFRFTNPHGVLEFTVTKEDGSVEEWRAETNSPNALRRRGWKKDSLKPGDHIVITGFPSRDGDNYMRISLIVFDDGHELRGQALNRVEDQD